MGRTITLLMAILLLSCSFCEAQSNEDLSGGLVWESEPYMAIDPADPQHIVVAWMGNVPLSHICIKVIATFNGGATWSNAAAIPHYSPTYTSADVSMVFDHAGNIYATYIDSRKSPDSGAVFMVKSADGGLTWGTPGQVISGFADGSKYPLDRPWLAISRSTGTTPDTLYVTTKPAPWVAPPNRPYFMKSYDYGATWSAWRYIDSTGYLVGNTIQAPMAAPSVDSAGKFHCIYPAYLPAQSVYAQYIMASLGPANSFTYHVAETVMASGPIDSLAKAGGRFICDPTNNNHLAFVHIENDYGDLDVFSSETTDGGLTWSALSRVNDDMPGNGKMQDMVWANFDEHGNLATAWRDRRNAPGTGYEQPTEVWGAVKWKDSLNFSANFKLSDTAAPYDSAYLYGSGNDFMNVAMAQDTLSAVWGDVRTGVLNIWFARKYLHVTDTSTDTTSTLVKSIASELLPDVQIYPNPASEQITVEGRGITNIVLSDMTGKMVLDRKASSKKCLLDISGLAPGIYIAEVTTQFGIVDQKVEIR